MATAVRTELHTEGVLQGLRHEGCRAPADAACRRCFTAQWAMLCGEFEELWCKEHTAMGNIDTEKQVPATSTAASRLYATAHASAFCPAWTPLWDEHVQSA